MRYHALQFEELCGFYWRRLQKGINVTARTMMMQLLVLSLLLVHTAGCAQANSECDDVVLLGEIVTKSRVNGALVAHASWHPFPTVFSIHRGEYHRIKIESSKLFTHVEIMYQSIDGESRAQFQVQEKIIEGLDFVSWFEPLTLPGEISWTLKGDEFVCKVQTEVMAGD